MGLADKKADFAVSPEIGFEKIGLTELCQSFAPYFDGAFPGLDRTLQDLTLLDSTLLNLTLLDSTLMKLTLLDSTLMNLTLLARALVDLTGLARTLPCLTELASTCQNLPYKKAEFALTTPSSFEKKGC